MTFLICFLVPTAAPSNVKVLDGRNHDRLFVQWDPIPPNHINGDLGGYKVLYSLLSDTAVVSQKSFKISTHPSVNSATLTDLLSGSVYSIEVLAYNEVGDGIKSKSLRGGESETKHRDNCHMTAVYHSMNYSMKSCLPFRIIENVLSLKSSYFSNIPEKEITDKMLLIH